MKKISTLILLMAFHLSAEAGPRFFNAKFNSKILGTFKASIKVAELPLSMIATPTVLANVQRDNGQIIAMNCATLAQFNEVANVSINLFDSKQLVFTKNSSIDVVVSDSYAMNDSEEVCQKLSLLNLQKAYLVGNHLHFTVNVKIKNENFVLSVSALPFSTPIDVTVSGNDNQMSLEWLDLFTFNGNPNQRILNFSVYQTNGASVSYLEHGSVNLELQ